jgi:hypothetical protein
MKTWDDIKYLYYGIASRYKRYHPEYDVDELVDEAWLMTYPFINVTDYKLPHRIHQVIQGYIRGSTPKYRKKGIYHKPVIVSIDETLGCLKSQEKMNCFAIDNLEESIDMMDYVAEKAKQLNIEEKIILYLKFQFGLTNKKIGDLLNFTGERIRQKLDLTIGKLRDGLNA